MGLSRRIICPEIGNKIDLLVESLSLCNGLTNGLIVNLILELRHVDNELSSISAWYIDEMEYVLSICFQKCIDGGTLHKELIPEVLASYYLTVIKGMRVAGRAQVRTIYVVLLRLLF